MKNKITEWIFKDVIPVVTMILITTAIASTIRLNIIYDKVQRGYEDVKEATEENTELEKEIAVRFEQNIEILRTAVDEQTEALDKNTAVYEELIQLLRQMTQD